MDKNGVLGSVFDEANAQLTTSVVTATSTRPGEKQKEDENGVWDSVYDPATNTIRVIHV